MTRVSQVWRRRWSRRLLLIYDEGLEAGSRHAGAEDNPYMVVEAEVWEEGRVDGIDAMRTYWELREQREAAQPGRKG